MVFRKSIDTMSSSPSLRLTKSDLSSLGGLSDTVDSKRSKRTSLKKKLSKRSSSSIRSLRSTSTSGKNQYSGIQKLGKRMGISRKGMKKGLSLIKKTSKRTIRSLSGRPRSIEVETISSEMDKEPPSSFMTKYARTFFICCVILFFAIPSVTIPSLEDLSDIPPFGCKDGTKKVCQEYLKLSWTLSFEDMTSLITSLGHVEQEIKVIRPDDLRMTWTYGV